MNGILKIATAAFALVIASAAHSAPAAEGDWYQAPFRIKAGDKPLDTFPADLGGHAAPFLADLDGDGLRDLTVGSIHGKFHFYKNIGTDTVPVFGAKATYLMAGLSSDEPAEVPNFCCVASGPQLLDNDGDGVLDLTSGSYHPGSVYWFKGRGDGTFFARQMVMDVSGRPVLPITELNPYEPMKGQNANLMTNVAWADWDGNEALDLILGNVGGQLFMRLNIKGVASDPSVMPSAKQPQFMTKDFQKFNEIRIAGGNAIPEGHAAPAVADWDGDGLWDILVGSESGRVYWLRNTGKKGAPVFKDRQEILGPGKSGYLVESGVEPGRGVRTQIQVVDYNRDGKLDLVVGDYSIVETIRPDLTKRERKEMNTLRRELDALDAKNGFLPEYGARYKVQGYEEDEAALKRAQFLETALTRFLTREWEGDSYEYLKFRAFQKSSGNVWCFLRK